MIDLLGRTAFITGGGSGIGLGMAKAFLGEGMKVAIGDVRADRIERAVGALRELSDDVLGLEVDVTDVASIAAAADATEDAFGNIHVLCNNAGIGGGGPVLDASPDHWRNVLDVNLWGCLHGIQTILPRILAHGERGHVVNTASFSGICGHSSQSAYGTSKFALVGLTENLRNDLADETVSVSVLCPHLVDTMIFHEGIDDTDIEAIEKNKALRPYLYGALTPESVGQQVVRGIKADELYIFCDGRESRVMWDGRVAAINGAFDRQFPDA